MADIIDVNFGEATDAIGHVKSACETLNSTFGDGSASSVSTYVSEYDVKYFTTLASYVKQIYDKGITDTDAALAYINELAGIAGGDGPGEKGFNGGAAPIGGGLGDGGTSQDPSSRDGMSEETRKKTAEAKDKADKLKKQGKMSEESHKSTMDAMGAAAALLAARKIMEKTYGSVIDCLDKAMDLLDKGKITDESYKNAVNMLGHAMNLVDKGKLSESALASTVATLDHALDLVDKDKLSEEGLNQTVNMTEHALDLVEAGKLDESGYKQTLKTTDQALTVLENGKMDEEAYKQTIATTDQALTALEKDKLSLDSYKQTMTTMQGALTQLDAGKITQDQYTQAVGSLNDALSQLSEGNISENAYKQQLSAVNRLINQLTDGKIDADTYNATMDKINNALQQLKNGEITEDEYKKLVQNILYGTTPSSSESTSVTSNAPQTNPSAGIPTTAPQTTSSTTGTTQTTGPTQTTTGTSIGGTAGVAGIGGAGVASVGGAAGLSASAADAASDSTGTNVGDSNPSLLRVLGQDASKLVSSVSPVGAGGEVNTKNATAGVIAAAGLAAAGAATGGGILAGVKLAYTRFTPEDWEYLGIEMQDEIEKLMRKVGFTEDEIETFKNSKFKIRTSELKEHMRKLEKVSKDSADCELELQKLYGFSLFDENGKVVDYLLFIAMIIDGKNVIDEYNMYNVINQGFESVDDADFVYAGIAMEDYFDDDKPEENVQIVNDPTIPRLSEEEDNGTNDALNKEWLQGIGMDN